MERSPSATPTVLKRFLDIPPDDLEKFTLDPYDAAKFIAALQNDLEKIILSQDELTVLKQMDRELDEAYDRNRLVAGQIGFYTFLKMTVLERQCDLMRMMP